MDGSRSLCLPAGLDHSWQVGWISILFLRAISLPSLELFHALKNVHWNFYQWYLHRQNRIKLLTSSFKKRKEKKERKKERITVFILLTVSSARIPGREETENKQRSLMLSTAWGPWTPGRGSLGLRQALPWSGHTIMVPWEVTPILWASGSTLRIHLSTPLSENYMEK